MDHDEIFFPTIVFESPAASPDRHRRPHRHRRVVPLPFSGDYSADSAVGYSSNSDDCSSSDGGFGSYSHHRPRRHRHRHIHLPTGLQLSGPNALARRPTAPAAPRNYGYRRLHYQGGQERRGRLRTRPAAHCHANEARAGCGARSPQRNILVRCGRWLFGESGRCYCGRRGRSGNCCTPTTGQCGNENGGSKSPTRHREEEYWGPGTHDWAYGPPSRNANRRGTPWSPGGNGGVDAYNLAPGGVVEEVEEGGTLPAVAAVSDQTHNHYHIGSTGRSRSNRRRGVRDYVRDRGVLGLVNRERDRELDRNMVDRQTADRERDRDFDRDMMDRETAKQRDHHLLALLDREREREPNGTMVDRDTSKQRDNRLLTLLDRERDRDRGGKDIMELLDQELERRRDLQPGISNNGRSKKRWKAREQSHSDSEEGLRAEMEALRDDFRKLMKSTSRSRGAVGTKHSRQGVSAVDSVASRSSGRQEPVADIQFTHARTIDDGDGEDEDKDDDQDYSAC